MDLWVTLQLLITNLNIQVQKINFFSVFFFSLSPTEELPEKNNETSHYDISIVGENNGNEEMSDSSTFYKSVVLFFGLAFVLCVILIQTYFLSLERIWHHQKIMKILIWTAKDSSEEQVFLKKISDSMIEACPNFQNKCQFLTDKKLKIGVNVILRKDGSYPGNRSHSNQLIGLFISNPKTHRQIKEKILNEDYSRAKHLDFFISYLPNSTLSTTKIQFIKRKKPLLMLKNTRKRHGNVAVTIMNRCSTPGKREDYIKELKKYIKIRVYGDCGVPCPGLTEEDCINHLAQFYEMFLVFDPYICEHHVEDRLWNILKTGMLPIVFGGLDYETKLPNMSFIDALDQSPKSLAQYLKYLNKRKTIKNKYFKWKNYLQPRLNYWPCLICEKLFNNNLKDYNVAEKIIATEKRCTKWPNLNFS